MNTSTLPGRLAAFAAVILPALSCSQESVPPLPEISVAPESVSIPYKGGSSQVNLDSNRPWTAVTESEWLVVEPAEGDSTVKEITVTALENPSGEQRTATITFKTSAVYAKLQVVQEADPSVAPSLYYVNDFDAEVAVDNDGWPYADSFDGWKNHSGSGADNVRYFVSGSLSVRANATSDGSYSKYDGSGSNNLFFGKDATVTVADIAIHQTQTAYVLSFGTEKFVSSSDDNTFVPAEFPVMISVDGSKWVSLEYEFAAGGLPVGEWDRASAAFVLPEPASVLWVRFAPTTASQYRLDDLELKISDTGEGQEVDWSKAVDITIPGA